MHAAVATTARRAASSCRKRILPVLLAGLDERRTSSTIIGLNRHYFVSSPVALATAAPSRPLSTTASTAAGTPVPTATATANTNQSKNEKKKKPRPDPTAKRPNKLCDPYGQGGKPLPRSEVDRLKSTIHEDWKVVDSAAETGNDGDDESDSNDAPFALLREFAHPDFAAGARFCQKVAAVAEMNAHYPSIGLERKIVRKGGWQAVTSVRCHTLVLGGLSSHDFLLAMLIDVEADRPDVKSLFLQAEED